MDKKTVEIRAKVDKEVKRKFEAAYRFKGVTYDEAIEQAMELFTKANIAKPDVSAMMKGTV